MINYIDENFFDFSLTDDEIYSTLKNKSVIVFGAGKDGEYFIENFGNKIDIEFFIDNGLSKKKIGNYDIYAVDECLKHKDSVIIITSAKYFDEMSQQLAALGLKPKENFYIFENQGKKYERDFVEHNKKVWKRDEDFFERKNKILINYYPNCCAAHYIIYSYIANYIADEYNAKIYAVPLDTPRETKELIANDYTTKIYKSFNTDYFIFYDNLTDSQKIKCNHLLSKIWNYIEKEEDILDICYDGVHYGGQILRDFYRYEMPSFEIKNDDMKNYLMLIVNKIIFWSDYFNNNTDVKAIIAGDGIYREGIMCHAAMAKGIKCYTISYSECHRLMPDINFENVYKNYNHFFEELTLKQQEYGLKWAKQELEKRFKGKASEALMENLSPYLSPITNAVLEQNDKIKIIICVHSFADDLYYSGRMIFSSVWQWLLYLGELSEKTDYDWYLKEHPGGNERDGKIVNKFLSKYKKIKLIPKNISPYQLKKEGVKFALTVWGTIGHEYPALGIQVINAGSNKHMSFNFDWNPRTLEEYEHYLLNLDKLSKEIDMDEIYKFYCVHYLYYDARFDSHLRYFFKDKELQSFENMIRYNHTNDKLYKKFITEWNPEKHKEILGSLPKLFSEMNNYRQDIFYMRENAYKNV